MALLLLLVALLVYLATGSLLWAILVAVLALVLFAALDRPYGYRGRRDVL